MRNRTSVDRRQQQDDQSGVGRAQPRLDRHRPETHTAAPTYNNLDYVTAQTDFLGYSTSSRATRSATPSRESARTQALIPSPMTRTTTSPAVTDARSVASDQTFDAVDRLTAAHLPGYSGEAMLTPMIDTASGNVGIGRLTAGRDESGTRRAPTTISATSPRTVASSARKTYTTSIPTTSPTA